MVAMSDSSSSGFFNLYSFYIFDSTESAIQISEAGFSNFLVDELSITNLISADFILSQDSSGYFLAFSLESELGQSNGAVEIYPNGQGGFTINETYSNVRHPKILTCTAPCGTTCKGCAPSWDNDEGTCSPCVVDCRWSSDSCHKSIVDTSPTELISSTAG